MDEMIKKAIEALQSSMCNEIELTDATGMKVKVVKVSPPVNVYPPGYYVNPYPYTYTVQY